MQQQFDGKKMQANRWRFQLPYGCGEVQHGVHLLIEHVQGFTRSHWMPPSGECLRRFAPAAVIVDEFVETTQNTDKTQLLPSNYGTFDR